MIKTWFVTGASRGLGRKFVEAALDRGDRVAATARDLGSISDLMGDEQHLLRLQLDITDREVVRVALGAAVDRFGVLDVIVNNAASGQLGAVEELSDQALRAVMDTNFFGAMSVATRALPILRAQGHGHIINISSMGGLIALPLVGAYIASKWALEGLTETLAQEVEGFGIAVTLVEPGPFATDQGRSTTDATAGLDAYQPLRDAQQRERPDVELGDPAAAAQALLRVVDAAEPPRRVIFGTGGIEMINQVYAQRLAGWKDASTYYVSLSS